MTNHTLPDLPYAYNALEPHICEEIMTLHHKKHHQTYVNGLNAAEASYAAASPRARIQLQSALKFNGGGHINHSLFWKNLTPANSPQAKLKDGPLKTLIDRDFGGLENLKKELNALTASIQGSGWGWLGYDTHKKRLVIETTANQDPLLVAVPLIGIDIWEHAFYIQYKNVKPDYLAAIWHIFNWEEAEKRLAEASSPNYKM